MEERTSTEGMKEYREHLKKDELIFVSADRAEFKEVLPGASTALLWGDDQTGPFGAFTRFEPGCDVGMHSHTNDMRVVVIKGAYLYKDSRGEKRIGAGDFLFIPGGMPHWSGGDPKEGALFYNESSGKFDLVPVKSSQH